MIDKSKTYRTRDGREVRIYATDGIGLDSVHGAMKVNKGWVQTCWRTNGFWCSMGNAPQDLIEVRPRHKRTVWLNVYPNNIATRTYASQKEANDHADHDRIACIKVDLDFEDGDGL